jgi:acetyl-CoA C-acetyltransferase
MRPKRRSSDGRDAVIIDYARSPIGRAAKGSLVDVRPDELAATVLQHLLERSGAGLSAVDELICGCGYPWGEQGFNVGRGIALLSGLPETTPAYSLTRLCASSLQALRAAHHAISLNEGDLYVVCGVESVSRVGRDRHLATFNPLLDGEGPGQVAFLSIPMIETAERVAQRFGVTREKMDAYAQVSQERAVAGQQNGFFAAEIVPIQRPDGSKVLCDDGPRTESSLEKLAALEPVTGPEGSITAGNSSPLNDGAVGAIVASADWAAAAGLQPRARILASTVSALDPRIMGVAPIDAIRRLTALTGLSLDDIDLIELNEAFAAQVIPCLEQLGVDPFDNRVNRHGGAIALGHPFGMSGLRLATTLVHGLQEIDGHLGIAALCVGGGQGQAMLVERLS